MRNTILIVDDIEINRIILNEILSPTYDILEAGGGEEAVSLIQSSTPLPDIILLDIMMPDMDGYEVLEFLKGNVNTKSIPVLFITAADANTNETKALNAGALDFISKPFNSDVVKARVDIHMQLSNYRQKLEAMVEEKTDEITLLHQRILETLATIVEYRNLESGQHIQRVKALTTVLVRNMLTKPKFHDELMREGYKDIIRAVVLHDVGKVGVPDNILLKPGKLTDEEFELMKTHTTLGGDIIDSISHDLPSDLGYLRHCRDIALYHHERWDGKGYMARLKGDEIPISARIVSIVDVFDAVSNRRCYKDAFSPEESLDIIVKGRGTQFDPDIVDCFLAVTPQLQEVINALRDPE